MKHKADKEIVKQNNKGKKRRKKKFKIEINPIIIIKKTYKR